MKDDEPYTGTPDTIEEFDLLMDVLIPHSVANGINAGEMAHVLQGHAEVLRVVDECGGIEQAAGEMAEDLLVEGPDTVDDGSGDETTDE